MSSQPIIRFFVAVLAVALLWPLSLSAQEKQKQLADSARATIAFELDAKALQASLRAMKLNVDEMFQNEKEILTIEKVSGAFSMPESIDDLANLSDEAPLQFYLKMTFEDDDAADEFYKKVFSFFTETKIDGKTYYVEKEESPERLMARREKAEIEVGTGRYLRLANRNVMSKGLAKQWKKMDSKLMVRAAFDLKGSEDILKELIAEGKEILPPPFQAFLELVDNAETLTLTADLRNETLVELSAKGVDEANAKELQEGLNALLGMAKLAIRPSLASAAKSLPESKQMLKSMMGSLNAKLDGVKVDIRIAKHKDFDIVMKKLAEEGQRAANSATKANELRQLALGVLNHESAYMRFPFNEDGDPKEDLSWRVTILPFIDEVEIYNQIDRSEGPDAKANAKFADKMPNLFGDDGKNAKVTWIRSGANGFGDITDGSSNTIMLIEYQKGKPWLQSNGITQAEAVKLVTDLKDGEHLTCVMYDGSTHRLTNKIGEETVKNLVDPKDGNRVDRSKFLP